MPCRFKHLLSLVTFVLVSVELFFPISLLAAGHTVSPLAFNLNVEKRDIITEIITLTNQTGQQIRLYASVNEVSVDGEGVVEAFVEPSRVDRTNTPTSWIEINRGRIELLPGEVKEVPFTIRMNPNTAPGDYSVFIGFAEGSNQPEASAKVMSGQAPGTLVNLVVDKKQNQFLRLERFVVDKFVTGRGVSEATYILNNPGVVDVVPKGEIIFYDGKGNEVAAVLLNPESVPIPRAESVTYTAIVPNDLLIGKYKAFLSVEYGENLTDTIQDTTYFYVFPLFQLSIIFLILLILAVLVTLYVHRHFDRDLDDQGAESVALYLKTGLSPEVHHDIDLKKKPIVLVDTHD